MKKKNFNLTLPVISILLILLLVGCNRYLKMNPPADVDKSLPHPPGTLDNSCWMATAANMLAGAGYGNGTNVQQRADDIYGDMAAHYGILDRGWPQAALQWWLGSANNTWTNNPYTLVSYHGNTSMYPWNNSDIPLFIGNELRKCHFLGLAFSWPTDAVDGAGRPIIGLGGHATTPWGDSYWDEEITLNPFDLYMTDSDRDIGGDLRRYNYDSYSNPNPGGPNEGNGCYFSYDNNHPYIRGIISLEPVDDVTDNRQTQLVVGSYRIHQGERISATDLHYTVGTDVNILSYKTKLDWTYSFTPTITENSPVRNSLEVDWDLTSKPVGRCNYITITTEFVLPGWNAIYYRNVHFTYPIAIIPKIPNVAWRIETPFVDSPDTIQDITGGYVIGSFEIINQDPEDEMEILAEYRFIHQYNYNQVPESHRFQLLKAEGLVIRNLKIGHTYSRLDMQSLWSFNDWMTVEEEEKDVSTNGYNLDIDWSGKLPYPKGIDVKDVIQYIRDEKPTHVKPNRIRLKSVR
jgi:hypothetical protein